MALLETSRYRDAYCVVHEGLRDQKRDFWRPLVTCARALVFNAFGAE